MTSTAGKVPVAQLFAEYWRSYGGAREVFRSIYFYAALVLVPLTFGFWSKPLWWDSVLSIIPSLLGISLAAFTLFLSAGSEGFREIIAGSDGEEGKSAGAGDSQSPFFKVATVFLHFLVVQFLAIIAAVVAKSAYAIEAPEWFFQINDVVAYIFWGFSFLLFLYSLTAVMAASFGVYEVVRWFDEYVTEKKKIESSDDH